MLVKSPAFSVTVIAVLALGIGLNTAVFALLKSLALSPLAGVEGSARLGVVLNETRAGRRAGLSYPDYEFIRDHDRAFTGLTGQPWRRFTSALAAGRNASWASWSPVITFSSLACGRRSAERCCPRMMSLPDSIPWSFSAIRRGVDVCRRPGIVGRTIHLNTVPMTVVGVADAAFHGTIVSFDTGVFAPLMMAPQWECRRRPQAATSSTTRTRCF